MLTIAKVTSGEAAASYYETADDYYAEEGHAPSAWWGKGARIAGLMGRVDACEFKTLLDGCMPDGSELHRGGAESRRAGTDLTFSAPKSVSMAALIGGDHRLIEVHELAVVRTLEYIEKNMAAYRLTSEGETVSMLSGNLLVAQFRHDLSRDADPQLHTHAVVLNVTHRPDGQWRALDAAPLYARQKFLGAMYRAELAMELKQLGYAIRLTHADGRFELAHISDAQVAAFSSRSHAIEAALSVLGKDRDSSTAREREVATLSSRKSKANIDRVKLREAWQEKSRVLGIDYTRRIECKLTEAERLEAVELAITFAIEHLMERESITNHDVLTATALGHATGIANLGEIETALRRRVVAGGLIEKDGRYTTMQSQALERDTLDIEARGRNAVAPIVRQSWLFGTEGNGLNIGQREAFQLILTTTNRVIGVQGKAGTGKTTMLSAVRDTATAHGWRCLGLAPSAAATHELGKAGIESETIAAYLARGGAGLDRKTLVVLDEAGMASTKDIRAVLTAVEQAEARIVLVGDTRQLKAVQAGLPFAQLQGTGMATARMDEIQRQKNAALKEAVAHAADGRVADSLKLLAPRIAEIDHATERYAAIARHYTALLPTEREQTLIVAGTNSAREAINTQTRVRLGLFGQGVDIRILQAKDLTEAQRKSSLSYLPADVVQMQRSYDSLGLRRGDLASVVAASGGRVTLQREDGERVEWRPVLMPHVAVYQVLEREITIGERIRITANDYARNLINGEFAKAVAIDVQRSLLTIEKLGGVTATLDMVTPLHIEHGYCTTVHSAQGKTCERVLIDADVRSAMANESLYYVAISRARSEVCIYTDDRALLPTAMSREDRKTTALSLTDGQEAGGRKKAALSM